MHCSSLGKHRSLSWSTHLSIVDCGLFVYRLIQWKWTNGRTHGRYERMRARTDGDITKLPILDAVPDRSRARHVRYVCVARGRPGVHPLPLPQPPAVMAMPLMPKKRRRGVLREGASRHGPYTAAAELLLPAISQRFVVVGIVPLSSLFSVLCYTCALATQYVTQ